MKNKIITTGNKEYDRIYARDVKLAIKWLKKELMDGFEKNKEGNLISNWVKRTIDEAFEDVIKDGRS